MDMERLTNAIHSLKITTYNGDEHRDHRYAAEINKLNEAEEQLLNRLDEFEERKRNSSAVYDGSEYVRDDDVVEINAGGKIVAARRGTLCQIKGTRLEALFSGRWDKKLQRDSRGRMFLDVNGDCFQAIVDFLNEMTISSEEDPSEPPTIDDDGNRQVLAQYLELFGLRVPPQMPESNIITQYSLVKLLYKWLNDENSSSSSRSICGRSSDVELSLIYHTSNENLSNENFRSTCANQGSTLIIIETIEGHIVGGYTNESWSSAEASTSVGGFWSKANKSFLFAIGFGMVAPCKMDLINATCKHAIYNCSQYGAAFGGGSAQCDLKVTGSRVYLNTGHVYEHGKSEKLRDGHIFTISKMEVFRVSDVRAAHHTHQQHNQLCRSPKQEQKQAKWFAGDIDKGINEKWASLRELEAELSSLEQSFDDEELFINAFTSGERKDIISLNVSGTIMVTKRSTLQVTEDSVLARQFDDTKWTEQGFSNQRVRQWSPDDVAGWIAKIAHIPDDVSALFIEHGVSGCELIALNAFGLKDIGVKRAGTICLLLKEIKKLKETDEDVVTLIEHSPYCFGKILDYLRLKRLHSIGLAEEPALPIVCESQRKRFEKVTKYYFPGESSSFVLGSPLEP